MCVSVHARMGGKVGKAGKDGEGETYGTHIIYTAHHVNCRTDG